MPRADEQRRRPKIHVEARGVKAVGLFFFFFFVLYLVFPSGVDVGFPFK